MLAEQSAIQKTVLVVAEEARRGRAVAAGLRRVGWGASAVRELPPVAPGCPLVLVAREGIDRIAAAAALLGGSRPLVVIDLAPELLCEALALGADEAVVRGAGAAEQAARLAAAAARCPGNGGQAPPVHDPAPAPFAPANRAVAADRASIAPAAVRFSSGYAGELASQTLSRSELEALLEITEAATSQLDLEELLRVVVARIAEVVPSDRCSAILLEDEEHAVVMASHDVPELRRLRIEVERYPEVQEAVKSRAPVVIDDLHTHPLMAQVQPLVSKLPVSSLVVAPLVAQGDAYGALFLRLARDGAFGESEKAFVRAAASAVANSVRNAKLHTSVRRKRDELEAAYQDRYEELCRLNDQLREANRIKDELLAICSHDLRSPLNTLLGHARLLQSAGLAPGPLRSAQAVERQGLRVLQLVQQILEHGRHRGGVAREREPVDLACLARSLAEDAMVERGVRVSSGGDAAVSVEGDASALRQVLENLVANAVSHSPDGAAVEVEVRLAGAADRARVEVRDRGPGIPEAELPLIFERYRKSGESRGLGLGLAICREIVEQHGGSIWAEAREGGGTCFVFTLPMRRAAEVVPRYLAICDDHEVEQGLEQVLAAGELVVAHTEREAVQQATLLLPEAILVQQSFAAAAQALRAEPGLGEVPLLFLGAAPSEEFRSLPLPLDGEAVRAALAGL